MSASPAPDSPGPSASPAPDSPTPSLIADDSFDTSADLSISTNATSLADDAPPDLLCATAHAPRSRD